MRRRTPSLVIVALLVVRSAAAGDQHLTPDGARETAAKPGTDSEDHAAVLEIGGVASVQLSDGSSHFGGSIAVEKTFVENWLELELGVSATGGSGEKELAASLLFKKPWTFSPRFEFMIGVGPELVHSLQPNGATAPGLVTGLDFMFWPSRSVGWYVEPTYELVFDHGSRGSFTATAGLLIGF